MRRILAPFVAVAVLAVAAPATAKLVDLTASPNPATLRTTVRHTVTLGAPARLDLYVSASGFERPGMGSLPPGSWTYRCCPSQTAGTPAWFYRSTYAVNPGTYRFPAVARTRGTFLSTAMAGSTSDGVWIRIT